VASLGDWGAYPIPAQTKEHETYLYEQHVDSGITDQGFKIGEYQSYVSDTFKATTQLAKDLERANTPSIRYRRDPLRSWG